MVRLSDFTPTYLEVLHRVLLAPRRELGVVFTDQALEHARRDGGLGSVVAVVGCRDVPGTNNKKVSVGRTMCMRDWYE